MRRIVFLIVVVGLVLSSCNLFQPPEAKMEVDKTEIKSFDDVVTVTVSSVGGDGGLGLGPYGVSFGIGT